LKISQDIGLLFSYLLRLLKNEQENQLFKNKMIIGKTLYHNIYAAVRQDNLLSPRRDKKSLAISRQAFACLF
jgi:hypothetical protein